MFWIDWKYVQINSFKAIIINTYILICLTEITVWFNQPGVRKRTRQIFFFFFFLIFGGSLLTDIVD